MPRKYIKLKEKEKAVIAADGVNSEVAEYTGARKKKKWL